jgi:hypothetical protein
MSWIEGARPHYFARLEREGPWWSVDYRDCPGCLTSGAAPGEVLIVARFSRSPGLPWWGGTRFAAPLASYWRDKARGWR